MNRLGHVILSVCMVCVATHVSTRCHADTYREVPLAVLKADRTTFTLYGVSGASGQVPLVVGRHDDLGLLSGDRENLSKHLNPRGLDLGDTSIPFQSIRLVLDTVDGDEALIAFNSLPAEAPGSDLVWLADSSYEQAAGEFWPGDVFVLNGTATIGGEVGGHIVVIDGDVIIREAATVRGGVVVIGGILRQRGDGKIYGTVHAPGGHRRARLSVTRAWEFEDEGVRWGPTFSYDRVDGARLGGNLSYQKSAYSPRLSVGAAYAIASETWQYRFGISQRLLQSTDLELQVAVFRLTDSEDEFWVGRHANTLYALLAGSDYRDYFGTDGGKIELIYKYRSRGILSVAYMNTDYRWLDAERGLWHLFRPNHCFRSNFSTVPFNILEPWIDRFEERTSAVHLTVGVEPEHGDGHVARFDGSARVLAEVAGGALGGERDYDRVQLFAKGEWNGSRAHRVTTRLWYGKGRRDLPPNKFFYLGGVGTLPGYPQKSFSGNQALLLSTEYRFDYWPNQVFDGGIILFLNMGRATFEADFLEPSKFKTDVGIGLGVGDGLRIDLAKGLDHTDRDIRLSLRLWQKW